MNNGGPLPAAGRLAPWGVATCRAIVSLGYLAALSGCAMGSLCDPGQRYDDGECVAASSVTDGGLTGEDGRARGDLAACQSTIGNTCAVDDDCGCDTERCLMSIGGGDGICTRTDCATGPTVCPSGWTCIEDSSAASGSSVCAPR